ncbi:hypothetical protein ACC672_37675, partial [Rhizobium ruizarguesonis]
MIFAAAHGSTYPGKYSSGYALTAHAIRAASQDDAPLIEHWDFDPGTVAGIVMQGGWNVAGVDAGERPANEQRPSEIEIQV